MGCVPWHGQLWNFLFSGRFPAPQALPSPGAPAEAATPPDTEAGGDTEAAKRRAGTPHHWGPSFLPPFQPRVVFYFFWDVPCPHPPREAPWGHRALPQRVRAVRPPQSGTAAVSPRCPPLRGRFGDCPHPTSALCAGPRRVSMETGCFFPIPVFPAVFHPPEPGPAEGQREQVRGFGDAPRGHPATLATPGGAGRRWRLLPAAVGVDFGSCRRRNPISGQWWHCRDLCHGRVGDSRRRVLRPSRGSRAVWDPLPGGLDPSPGVLIPPRPPPGR